MACHHMAQSMAHVAGRVHLFDKRTLERVERAVLLGLIGSGLAACAFGAIVYDVGRWFSVW